MAGIDAPSLPSFTQLASTVTSRNGEYAGTPFSDEDGDGSYNTYLGCNRAGSNAPGVGINTGDYSPKGSDWSLLDQNEAPRTPQDSQHIGGDGLAGGTEGLTTEVPVQAVIGTDFNDTMSFVTADNDAAPGAPLTTGGPINRTGKTVPTGANSWGTDTVA